MKLQNTEQFIRNVEDVIRPMDVSNLLFFQGFRKLLPSSVFKRLLFNASKKTPHIGFVIEAYSLFLFFKLKDIERAKSMLPDRYELAKARIFADEEPDYYYGIGNLNTRATTFWGVRQESYLIATDRETGLLSWIFIDILSNTIIALPTTGIADPNSSQAIFATNSNREVILDVREDRTGRRLSLAGSIGNGTMRELDESLWVMGNTSIGHCNNLADGDDIPFAVIFDPNEVAEGLDIPTKDIVIRENTLFPGLAEPEPCKVICFPFPQHYIADSPGCHTSVKDTGDLVAMHNSLGAGKGIRTFSAKTVTLLFFVGIALSTSLSVLFLVLLIL